MPHLNAAIEIGTTGIRLLVEESDASGKSRVLDKSEFPVSIGRDVFTTGAISRATLLQILKILNRYREQLLSWGLKSSDAEVVATSAFRESENRDSVLDRINVKTGFRVRVIDGIEENRLMFLAVANCLKGAREESKDAPSSKLLDEGNSIILEVSGGSTEIMLLENGSIAGAHSLRLGTVIIEQQLKKMGSIMDARRYVSEYIANTKGSLKNELDLGKVRQFIAVGNDISIAALFAGKPISTFLWQMEREDFDRFVSEIKDYSAEEIVARFKLPHAEAESLHLNLLVFQLFISLTNTERIFVPETNIREGLLLSRTKNGGGRVEFHSQIIASAQTLLKKYRGDESHAEHVRQTAGRFFDALKDELGLKEDARMLLEIAAILHDIGTFIRAKDHNEHSKYIIEHSEIFGLNREDIEIISQIVLWHRGHKNMGADSHFRSLPRDARLTILKLTAILKIADALDRSHTQRIKNFKISFSHDTMMIQTDGSHNNVLEKLAVREKSDTFESVFGYKVLLL